MDPSEVKVANGYSATDDLKYEMMRNLADNKNSPNKGCRFLKLLMENAQRWKNSEKIGKIKEK